MIKLNTYGIDTRDFAVDFYKSQQKHCFIYVFEHKVKIVDYLCKKQPQ